MENWITGGAALEEVADREDHRPHDKNAYHGSNRNERRSLRLNHKLSHAATTQRRQNSFRDLGSCRSVLVDLRRMILRWHALLLLVGLGLGVFDSLRRLANRLARFFRIVFASFSLVL